MIVALRDRAEDVRQAELDRYRARLGGLDPGQLDAVDAPHAGHHRQAAPRSVGGPQGRRRARPGAIGSSRRCASCSPSTTTTPPPPPSRVRTLRAATRGSPLADLADRARRRAARAPSTPTSPSRSSWSTPRATGGSTCRSGSSAARACSPRRCRPPCSTGGPTSRCTAPRTCRRSPCPGLVIAAVPERGDPRDALVGSTLAALPEGRGGGHRLAAPPGRAAPPPAGPSLREPAREHADAPGQGGGRTTPSSWRPPPSTASASAEQIAERLSTDVDAPAGRPGGPRRRVPRGRRRAARPARAHRARPPRAAASTPSGRSSPSWAATARSRPAAPRRASTATSSACEAFLASPDGRVHAPPRGHRPDAVDRRRRGPPPARPRRPRPPRPDPTLRP